MAPFPLIAATFFARAYLAGIGNVYFPLLVTSVAAAVNIGLDFLLIPRYDAGGAAVANSVTQVGTGIAILVYVARSLRQLRLEAAALARTALAAAASGGAAWATGHAIAGAAGVVAGLAVGTAVFFTLGALLRILTTEDAAWLEESIGSALGGLLGRTVRLWARPA